MYFLAIHPSEEWKHCLAATVEAWLAILDWDTDKPVLSTVVNKPLVVVNTILWSGRKEGISKSSKSCGSAQVILDDDGFVQVVVVSGGLTPSPARSPL